jgi:hypothetical protein
MTLIPFSLLYLLETQKVVGFSLGEKVVLEGPTRRRVPVASD